MTIIALNHVLGMCVYVCIYVCVIILILLFAIYVISMIVYLSYNENGFKCKYPWYYSIFGKNDDIVAASDAFFPFVDGIEKLVQSGVSAIIQPSGSIRDKEIINFANQTDTVLVFSKTRHFRH